jgi:hypothetical protein
MVNKFKRRQCFGIAKVLQNNGRIKNSSFIHKITDFSGKRDCTVGYNVLTTWLSLAVDLTSNFAKSAKKNFLQKCNMGIIDFYL